LGIGRLRAFLQRHERIALDTSVFISHIEANPRYRSLTETIFFWLESPGASAVTSSITMTELLVPAYRLPDQQQAGKFYALLSRYPNLDWVAPTLEVADSAAQIRAQYGLRTPDALQAATAAYSAATGLLSNDPIFERVDHFETLVLDSLL
jgi:predicted nucleic acid-binding protein